MVMTAGVGFDALAPECLPLVLHFVCNCVIESTPCHHLALQLVLWRLLPGNALELDSAFQIEC